MRRSFQFAAMLMAIWLVTGTAGAQMVDIGTGRMARSEFDALRRMIGHGHVSAAATAPIEPAPAPRRVAEFDRSTVRAIREAMETAPPMPATVDDGSTATVDIGTGAMQTREFCDLNKLVARNTNAPAGGFSFLCP